MIDESFPDQGEIRPSHTGSGTKLAGDVKPFKPLYDMYKDKADNIGKTMSKQDLIDKGKRNMVLDWNDTPAPVVDILSGKPK